MLAGGRSAGRCPGGHGDHRICRCGPRFLRQARERVRQRAPGRDRQGSAGNARGLMRESEVIERLRAIATHEAARGLLDDAALFHGLVITHDSIAEGVHFLPFDPPASVGWKLVTVNLSDLAAKGAAPAVALLSLTIRGDSEWEDEFITGVEAACESY